MNFTTVETAIPLSEYDLEEPLIPCIVLDDEEQHGDNEEWTFEEEVVQDVLRYFQTLGWTLGFLLQCISLGATALMALYYDHIPTSDDSMATQTMYWVMSGLSNSWLLLFPVVCIAIERSWNDSGIRFLQTKILGVENPVLTTQTKRMTFVASVRFLIGIVLGCFMTWGLIDLYLNASYSMLLVLFLSMMACLVLCQGMIVIYDSFTS